MINESLSLLFSILLIIILNILAHALYCRFVDKDSTDSPQKTLIIINILGLPFLFSLIAIINYFGNQNILNQFFAFIYGLSVYSSFMYAYFHLFNMSETARRIKIIVFLAENNEADLVDLEKFYPPEDMIRTRLRRLSKMGAIEECQPGMYFLKGKFLWLVACLFASFRKIIKL